MSDFSGREREREHGEVDATARRSQGAADVQGVQPQLGRQRPPGPAHPRRPL